MKNVLIYLYKSNLKPVGGHHGYNYNLNIQLEKKNVKNVHFIETEVGNYERTKSGIEKISIKWIRLLLIIIKNIVRKGLLLYGRNHKSVVELNEYDIVHFQSTYWMYVCRDSLKKCKAKVVLTSHSPTLLSKEIFDELTNFEKKYMKWFYKRLIKMDEFAFERADYVIFPCPESEEPYFHAWDKFSAIKDKNPLKFRYLLSGIEPCIPKKTRDEVRKTYGIPKDAFLICYVGRHCEIKGYDLLKQVGMKLLDNPNNYIIVAGREEPLCGLSHKRWIEIGWTNDPYSIIAAADVFILPNKETYFDLVMLEVLSIGKIVVASRTGGNKYFDRYKQSGIFLYDDMMDCLAIIKNIETFDLIERERLEKVNKNIYETYFTSSIFVDNYLNLIESLN